MNYYWYDHLLEGTDGEAPNLDGFGDFVTKIGAKMTLKPRCDVNDRVCFVHAGDCDGKTQQDWEKMADSASRRFVVLVSSHPEGLVTNRQGVYAIKAPLPSVVKWLDNDPQRINKFKETCEQGTPDITHLELPYPEYLVSALLLGEALKNNKFKIKQEDVPSDLWDHAQREYRELVGGGDNSTQITFNNLTANLDNIKKILAKIGRC